MNFPKNFIELMPYIVFVVALEVFYLYTLKRHDAEMKKLKDKKTALLEILLAFLRHETGIQHSKNKEQK
ncbi:MAG: hypothetical protein V1762_02365 [Nitrospirota bacterium]